ncbi:MAG: YggS family pyridoxal phosphate-dependent enzyme [Chloroflexi bacterium]|nr:YggS family pyridoxal phosphate-dependent enzyme [Chloroflexota bacterium]
MALAERLAKVHRRIEAACARAGRDAETVTLVAVSKTHPPDTVAAAITAGVTALGENRAQEFVPKVLAAREAGLKAEWHFIGHLQRNKVREILPYVDVLHSLDSERLIRELVARAPEARPGHRRLRCFIEVNVAGEQQKEGVPLEAVGPLLEAARSAEVLDVRGLMTVAPHVGNPQDVRPVFARLRELAAEHGLPELSMGMTDDFEVAIEEGATLVRVGRAIFGDRLG